MGRACSIGPLFLASCSVRSKPCLGTAKGVLFTLARRCPRAMNEKFGIVAMLTLPD